jgi:cell division protein ZapA
MSQESVITIKILDRLYKIKCTASEALDLHEAANHVDEQMRKIRQAGHITSIDRMAVVAALNIYSELLQLKRQKNQCIDSMSQRISELQRRIEEKLAEKDQIVV